MSPINLPNELLLEILSFIRPGCTNPLDILLVSSDFRHLFSQLLYGQLELRTISQLARFLDTFSTSTQRTIPQPIRNVMVDLYNDMGLGLYSLLRDFFSLCASAPGAEIDDEGCVVFQKLTFRFHTHTRDPTLHIIHEALLCVNPREFTWMGPDPPHHFSAAIVPSALSHALKALATRTNLTQVTLTHVIFPGNGESLSLPRFPSLKFLTLSQVTFLHPDIIACFILDSDEKLELVRLIDAYTQGIWGPRLRRSHIEAVARSCIIHKHIREGAEEVHPNQVEDEASKLIQRIRCTVVCQGKNERIIGGDRMLSHGLLI